MSDVVSLSVTTFGEKLRAARKAAGLTQAIAAGIAEVRQGIWTQYECGTQRPDLAYKNVLTKLNVVKARCPDNENLLAPLERRVKEKRTRLEAIASAVGVTIDDLIDGEKCPGDTVQPPNQDRVKIDDPA